MYGEHNQKDKNLPSCFGVKDVYKRQHYDNVAHDLNASYEDVQEGMSTPYGIARTTTFTLIPQEMCIRDRWYPVQKKWNCS